MKDTFEVIGIHKSGVSNNSKNYGNFIGPIFNFFINFSENKNIMYNNIYEKSKDIKNNIINNINLIENINDIPLNQQPNDKLNKIILLFEINENSVQLFGEKFVKNNKDNCYLIIKGEERELYNTLYLNEIIEEKSILEVTLIEKSPITNLSYMFHNDFISQQISLISLPDICEWNTVNVKDMNNMFYGCSSLLSLPDISKWNTMNVKDMNNMFCGCSSLLSLPDISKWNTMNVKDMSSMFFGCNAFLYPIYLNGIQQML